MFEGDRLRRFFDSGVVGLVWWDVDGAIVDANDKFLEMFGYTHEDLETGGLHWTMLTRGASIPTGAAAATRVHQSVETSAEDGEYQRKDGTRLFVRLRSTTFDDDTTKVLSVAVDISDQKRAEAERDALLECERHARAEAEAAVSAREEILAIVSHDLRNPLNSISISASVLETAGNGSPLPQVGIIHRAVGRMSRLIQDLLDVGQITSGRLEVQPTAIALATLFEEIHIVLQPQLLRKNLHFAYESPDATLVVLADGHRIMQVLSNLIGNAIKFTPEGGRVSLSARRDGDHVLVEVSDSGQGIDQQDLPNIFDRFWQARRVRRGGVGLGLPIAKGIVDAHGGQIRVQSSPGVGTTFSFTLPLATQRP
jgi:PAS domain S-box-containing protein